MQNDVVQVVCPAPRPRRPRRTPAAGGGHSWRAATVPLVAALVLVGTPAAEAAARVEIRAATHAAFGRLVFEWPEPVEFTKHEKGHLLGLRFARPLVADLSAVAGNLAEYLDSVQAVASDEVQLTLKPDVIAKPVRIDEHRVVVDFTHSPRVESDVCIRTGSHEGFERLVFEWGQPVGFDVYEDRQQLVIEFDQPRRVEVAHLARRIPTVITAADARFTPSSTRLVLALQPGTGVRTFRLGEDRVVVDLSPRPESVDTATGAGDLARHRIEALYRKVEQVMVNASSAASGGEATSVTSAGADWPQLVTPLPAPLLREMVAGQAGPTAVTSPAPDEAQERAPELEALNRVLVEAGGLLLPLWQTEVSPSLQYTHRGANGLLITEVDGVRQVLAQDVRRDTIEAALTARLGLPWDFQGEVRVPYIIDQETVSMAGVEREDHNGTGLGDVEVALTHQLLREHGALPDLLAEVRWRVPTGEDSFSADVDEIAVGSGFHGISGALTAVKSYDPLVFFGSASYTANLPDTKSGFDVDPGDAFGFALGTILAAGPGASLRLGISQTFTGEAEVEGREIAGSDEVSGIFQVGASAALPWRTLLDFAVGIGITEDAPDLALKLSLPYRF